MRKLLNKPWVVALLAFAAVALVWQSLLDQPKRRSQGATTSDAALASEDSGLPESAVAGSIAEALASLSFPESLPDPFAARAKRVVEVVVENRETGADVTETVRLSAIWEQDGSAYILLNGRICRSGDTVGRITIASIEREGVWLTHWKGRDFVRLGQDFTLITPATAAAQPRNATHEG